MTEANFNPDAVAVNTDAPTSDQSSEAPGHPATPHAQALESSPPVEAQSDDPSLKPNLSEAFRSGFHEGMGENPTYDIDKTTEQASAHQQQIDTQEIQASRAQAYQKIETAEATVNTGIDSASEKIIKFVENTTEKAKSFVGKFKAFGEKIADRRAKVEERNRASRLQSKERIKKTAETISHAPSQVLGKVAKTGTEVLETTQAIYEEANDNAREAMNWMDAKMLEVQHSIEERVTSFAGKVRATSEVVKDGLEVVSRMHSEKYVSKATKNYVAKEVYQTTNKFLNNLEASIRIPSVSTPPVESTQQAPADLYTQEGQIESPATAEDLAYVEAHQGRDAALRREEALKAPEQPALMEQFSNIISESVSKASKATLEKIVVHSGKLSGKIEQKRQAIEQLNRLVVYGTQENTAPEGQI